MAELLSCFSSGLFQPCSPDSVRTGLAASVFQAEVARLLHGHRLVAAREKFSHGAFFKPSVKVGVLGSFLGGGPLSPDAPDFALWHGQVQSQ